MGNGNRSVTIAAGLVCLFDLSINLADHAYKPDLYYLALGYAAIALMLLTKPLWSHLFRRLTGLNTLLLFVSRHAYPIFLLHSFYIFASERWLGLVSVAQDPLKASFKVVFVLVATAITAVPFSHLSRLCIRRVDAMVAARSPSPASSVSQQSLQV